MDMTCATASKPPMNAKRFLSTAVFISLVTLPALQTPALRHAVQCCKVQLEKGDRDTMEPQDLLTCPHAL